MKIILIIFSNKNFVWGKWAILGPKMAYSYNSGSALRQGMIFQVNIYVMDIVWMLCDVYEWRSKFNRGSYGFVMLL